ncbi:DUF3558 domain-containing protein [Pseudonocardia saturnea]
MRRWVVLCVVAVLTGCSAPVVSAPSPVPATPAPSTSAAPAVELPPRPREIRVDDLDPCTLLTAEQRAELELDREPVLDVAPSGFYGGVTQLCSVRRLEQPGYRMAVQLSVTAGVEAWLRPGVPADVAPIDVQGFPAIEVRSRLLSDICTVAVDVAPGQVLDVLISNGGETPVASQDRLCELARQAAGLAMTTLQKLR